jgi:hypothetical protein
VSAGGEVLVGGCVGLCVWGFCFTDVGDVC